MWNNSVVRYSVVGVVSVAASTYCLAHGVRFVKRLLEVRREFLEYLAVKQRDANANVANVAVEPVVVAVVDGQPSRCQQENADAATVVNDVLWTNERTAECFVGDECIAMKSKGETLCSSRFCPTQNINRVMDLLKATTHTLDVAMYSITSHEVFTALYQAHQRNVKIRIITDREMVFAACSKVKALLVNGVPVRFARGTALMHHKFCIMDGPMRVHDVYKGTIPETQLKSLLLCGSQNWTNSAFMNNFENTIVTSNQHFVEEYETEFERLWNSEMFNFGIADIKMVQHNGDATEFVQMH